MEAADAVLKSAPVTIPWARPVSPGKYVFLVAGGVDPVKHAMQAGRAGREDWLVDDFVLPHPHAALGAAIRAERGSSPLEAVGIIETMTVASCVTSADVALKTARVSIVEMRLAAGIGGKSYAAFTGEVSDVRSAVVAGSEEPRRRGLLVREVVIPQAHPDMQWLLGRSG
ncbi:MAG: BMC domain-containing protein [Planctomycetes bacterium]|nr:BMC domain-containing protein [Planctomycetota bacterium]